ncbi:MAG: nuclear transport factor 2 family protein [Cyclobacteriaceae bacterium]
MTVQEVADRLVELLRVSDYETIYKELFSPEIVSAEPEGAPWGEVKGFDALAKKGKEFGEMVESFISSEISDPIVADDFISLSMKSVLKWKGATEPTNADEICVYTVKDGKIVREEFFYTPQPQS